jgi:hypothetical protein
VQLPGGELNEDALLRNAKGLDMAVVHRLMQMDAAYECPICLEGTDNPSVPYCGHLLCGPCLQRLTETDNATEGRPSAPACPQCRTAIDVNNVTDFTSFRKVHCPELNETVNGVPQQYKPNSETDSDSGSEDDDDDSHEGDDLGGFIVYNSDDEYSRPSKNRTGNKSGSSARRMSKSEDNSKSTYKKSSKTLAELRKESLRNKAARKKYLKRLRKDYQPAAKTTRLIELLQEIKDRGGKEKTIVFSNFTSFLDIIETQMYDHPDLKNYVRSVDKESLLLQRTEADVQHTDTMAQ